MLRGPFAWLWRAGWSSSQGSGSEYSPFFVFAQDGGFSAGVELHSVGGATSLEIWPATDGSAPDIVQPLTFEAGDLLEFVCNPVSRTVAIFGARSGNGVFTAGPGASWWASSNQLRVGHYGPGADPSMGPIGGGFSSIQGPIFTGRAHMLGILHPTDRLFMLAELDGATLPYNFARTACLVTPNGWNEHQWQFTFTPSWASTADRGEWPGALIVVHEADSLSEAIEFHKVGDDLLIEVNNGLTNMVSRAVTFDADQTLTIRVKPLRGQLTIEGATTGNGTSIGNAFAWWPNARAQGPGALTRVGDYFGGGGSPDGTFGNLFAVWNPA